MRQTKVHSVTAYIPLYDPSFVIRFGSNVSCVCVCVCVCVCYVCVRVRVYVCVYVCQRKTKDRADGMREKSAHSPRQDLNPHLWDTHPSCFRLHHEGRHVHLMPVETNTSDTHPLAPSWNTIMQRNTPTPICGTMTPVCVSFCHK